MDYKRNRLRRNVPNIYNKPSRNNNYFFYITLNKTQEFMLNGEKK